MATAFESAQLNLQLFEMRREAVLREARNWFLTEFHPQSYAEYQAILGGERNHSIRMVVGYWDMAASLVTGGAIDGDAFRAAHGEIFAAFSKVQPFLEEIRAGRGELGYLQHMERVVMDAPGWEATLERRRKTLLGQLEAKRLRQAQAASEEVK